MTIPITLKKNISTLFILLVYLVIQFSILGEAAAKDPTPSVKKMIGFSEVEAMQAMFFLGIF